MSTIDLKLKSYDELIFEITTLTTNNYLLQQKVEQLEKENKELKYDCSCSFHDAEELNQKLTETIDERNELDTKLIQLENIRKEAIEYVYKHIQEYDVDGTFTNLDEFDFIASPQALLNILNKGDNKE